MKIYHTPILAQPIIDFLSIKEDSIIADLTTGEGGHSSLIAPLNPKGQLICLDRDTEILARAQERLSEYTHITYINDTYDNIQTIQQNQSLPLFDGILIDMGISMFHYKGTDRGFSFEDDSLDMRLGSGSQISADDIINTFAENDLADIFYYYGEERASRKIARAITQNRPFHSAKEFSDFILKIMGRRGKIHPATKVFQGLRIFVNQELEIAEKLLENIISCLNHNGVLCILTFHSLEDRLVKRAFKVFESQNLGTCVINKPMVADAAEVQSNPASRSAKLRVFKRS